MIVDVVVIVVMVFEEVFVVVHVGGVVFMRNDSHLSHLFLRSVRFPATRAHDLFESEEEKMKS